MDASGTFAVFGPWMVLFGLVLARVSALVVTAPFFNSQTIPVPVKVGLVGVVTLFVAVNLRTVPQVADFNALRLIALIAGEMMVGALMGVAVSILFGALALAGQLVGTQMGLSMANLMDPFTFQQTGLMGQVLNIVALLLFLVFDGHLLMLRALFESFELVPVTGVSPHGGPILAELMRVGGLLFELGLRIALPVVVTVLFVNVGLAIIARTVPQVNVFQLGFIITVGLGIAVTALALPGMRQVVHRLLEDGVRAAMRLAAASG